MRAVKYLGVIINVKQTFMSGAGPGDPGVKTVTLLFYLSLATKWVGKGYCDPLASPPVSLTALAFWVISISRVLSVHYRVPTLINAFFFLSLPAPPANGGEEMVRLDQHGKTSLSAHPRHQLPSNVGLRSQRWKDGQTKKKEEKWRRVYEAQRLIFPRPLLSFG